MDIKATPIIKLLPGEVVQMEGWLNKRRVGYDNEDDIFDESVFNGPTPLAPTGSKLEALLLRRTEKKRYFVLTTFEGNDEYDLKPRSQLIYCSKKPKYTKLDHNDLKSSSIGPPLAVFEDVLASQSLRGTITLNDMTDVTLLQTGEIRIVVPGKSYFIHPMGKKTPESQILIGQWYTHIQQAKKTMWMLENRKSELLSTFSLRKSDKTTDIGDCPDNLADVLKSPLYRRQFVQFCEFSHGSENMEFYIKVEEYEQKFAAVLSAGTTMKRSSMAEKLKRLSGKTTPRLAPKDIRQLGKEIINLHVKESSTLQVNLCDTNRKAIEDALKEDGEKAFTPDLFAASKMEILELMETNYFLRFYREQQRKTGCFSQLYGKKGIKGYQAVIAHFGRAKTDLERLQDLYKLRMDQTEAQLQVLRDALKISHDVAIPSLNTTRDCLSQLYRSNAVRVQALNEFKLQLNEFVVFPLTWLNKSMDIQLESIMTTNDVLMDDLDTLQKKVDDNKKKVQDLEVLIRLSALDNFPTPEAEERLKEYQLEPSQLQEAMESTQEDIALGESHLTRKTKELEDKIIDGLDKLESLELHRLESQQRAIKHAIQAEKHLFESLHSNSIISQSVMKRMDPPSDIANFVKEFTAKVENKIAKDPDCAQI